MKLIEKQWKLQNLINIVMSIQAQWRVVFISALEMPSSHPILWCSDALLLLPSIFPAIRLFSNELAICIRWPKYWSFSFSISISPSNEYSGLTSLKIDRFDLPIAIQGTLRSLLQHHSSKSGWLYSLQLKMEKLYTVSKNKTRSWLWLRSWTPYCQIQT